MEPINFDLRARGKKAIKALLTTIFAPLLNDAHKATMKAVEVVTAAGGTPFSASLANAAGVAKTHDAAFIGLTTEAAKLQAAADAKTLAAGKEADLRDAINAAVDHLSV